jgi:hypothetical protein
MKLLTPLILFAFIIIYSAPAFGAGSTLSISPSKYDLKIEAGQIEQATVKITNQSDTAMPMHVAIMDFAPKDTQGGVTYGTAMPGHSAKDWFSINKPDMILSPGESETVTATISPPDRLADGSYFAVVMFQATLPTVESEESHAQIVPWIGTLFLLKKGGDNLTGNDLTITNFSMPRFSSKTHIPVTLEIQNNTNFHITPDTDIELKTPFGKVAARTTFNDTIMPGMKRLINGEVVRMSPLGLYKGVANVRVASYQKNATSGWLYLITLLGLAILAAFLAGGIHGVHHGVKHHRRYRNRFKAAWHAFRHKH